MPRIEIIPENWSESREAKRGDSTPTIDVCRYHARLFPTGRLLHSGRVGHLGGRVSSTDVAHPPYELERVYCTRCGRRLTEEDN